MFDFSDQAVIVTGGTRGIGREISETFLAAGAEVHALYRANQAAADALAADCAKWGTLHLHRLDVTDEEGIRSFYDALEVAPRVLVNNAGIRRDQVLGMMSREDWQAVLDTNLTGTFLMSKYAVRRMSRERRGRIINITSPSSSLGFPGQANYAASKAGQVALTKVLAKEVATRNITVNCVSPGVVETELLADLDDERRQALLEMVPMRRFGRPADVAGAVLFLASPSAAYITGTTLDVTGGM